MRFLLNLTILFFSVISFAQESRLKLTPPPEPTILKGYLLGVEARYEKTADLDWADRHPFNFAIAIQKKQFDFVMEYAKFTESSGNATLSVDREHQELVFWGRWHAYEKKWEENRVSLYAGAGLGRYLEKVDSSSSGNSHTADTDYQWMSGLSVGAEVLLPFTEGFGFVGALEGRVLMSSDFDPNPLGSGVLRLGLFMTL